MLSFKSCKFYMVNCDLFLLLSDSLHPLNAQFMQEYILETIFMININLLIFQRQYLYSGRFTLTSSTERDK